MAKGLAVGTGRLPATEVGGSVWLSCTPVSSFMPRMPPFLFMSSTARLTASRHMAPTLAPPPVISATIGSLITPWAPAGAAASRLNSAARSGVANPNRRMGTSSLECVVVNTSTERRRARIALPTVETSKESVMESLDRILVVDADGHVNEGDVDLSGRLPEAWRSQGPVSLKDNQEIGRASCRERV